MGEKAVKDVCKASLVASLAGCERAMPFARDRERFSRHPSGRHNRETRMRKDTGRTKWRVQIWAGFW